ncbi:hypothetical protein SLEP1_g15337 [Rubroshorea leprosula]|uniref:Uncharacterized protein n=1 Tax=Rubroshorea leprosula TaxID=152421 RepID=A0AAV5IRB1_9ROSI|nr:hypothetical protein SLEP1_g15337 [Rubroshorea leprosula]
MDGLVLMMGNSLRIWAIYGEGDGVVAKADGGGWRFGRVQVMGCGRFSAIDERSRGSYCGGGGVVGKGTRSDGASDTAFRNEEEATGDSDRRWMVAVVGSGALVSLASVEKVGGVRRFSDGPNEISILPHRVEAGWHGWTAAYDGQLAKDFGNGGGDGVATKANGGGWTFGRA